MSTLLPSDDFIEKAILTAVRTRIREEIANESKDIEARVMRIMSAAVDQLAISVMSHYEIYRDVRGIHIYVKKETK